MTEKEKMLKGMLYNASYDTALVKERDICNDLCYEYNNTQPSNIKKRENIIKKLLGSTKENFYIEQPFKCDYGYNIHIGNNFYTNTNCVILDVGKVVFGNDVFIAPNCSFFTAGHPLDPNQRSAGLEFGYPITVGDNVWIGGGAIVMPGVTIGSNTVIGAGSIVTKDIPSGVLALGNPCKVIRKITEKDILETDKPFIK